MRLPRRCFVEAHSSHTVLALGLQLLTAAGGPWRANRVLRAVKLIDEGARLRQGRQRLQGMGIRPRDGHNKPIVGGGGRAECRPLSDPNELSIVRA